jgi:acyl carrier protein
MKFHFITKCSVIAPTIGLASTSLNVNLLPNAYASSTHAGNCTSKTNDSKQSTPTSQNKDSLERIKAIIADQSGIDVNKIKGESSLIDDLGADSLDTVELVMAIEEEFDIEIADEDAEKFFTVGNINKYVVEKSLTKYSK